jgi:hypothetical protein
LKVHVRDFLFRCPAVVLQHVETVGAAGVHDGSAEAPQGSANSHRPIFRQLVQEFRMMAGYHDRVAGRQGLDIQKGQDVFVLIDTLARDFAADDFAEDAVLIQDGVGHG